MHRIMRIFAVILISIFCLGVYSIAEELTLTTYYPAPYGAYNELTTTDNTYLATDSGNVGIGTTNPEAKLEVYEGDIILSNSQAYRINSTGGTNETVLTLDNSNNVILNDSASGNMIIKSGASRYIAFQDGATENVRIDGAGEVGIGVTNPTAKLHVDGNIKAVLNSIAGAPMEYNPGTDEIGFDVAEIFDATEEVEHGDLLVIDETKDIKLRKSNSPYEKGIVGIVSGSPAILFEGSQLEIAPAPGGFKKGTRPPVALAGRITCKVSIENGPIERGDLLTSSSTPGHAMKASDRDRAFGAIIGKALEPFNGTPDSGHTGSIIILIALQ